MVNLLGPMTFENVCQGMYGVYLNIMSRSKLYIKAYSPKSYQVFR
jgi:hypothetical protein